MTTLTINATIQSSGFLIWLAVYVILALVAFLFNRRYPAMDYRLFIAIFTLSYVVTPFVSGRFSIHFV